MFNRISKMKDELNARPFQMNFNSDEDREKAIEELFLEEEKLRQSDVLIQSKYSGAETQLEALEGVMNVIKKMRVARLQVSYVDGALFENKDATIKDIDGLIKGEGEGAVRTIAKKVLKKFWRYVETSDGATQTEEKVIDALKAQLFELQQKIADLKSKIDFLDREKSGVEITLD